MKKNYKSLKVHTDNLKVIYTYDNPKNNWDGHTGFLTKDKISDFARQELGLNYPVAKYYTCGPAPLMDVVVEGLSGIGVRDENIFTEYFTAKAKSTEGTEAVVSTEDTSSALNYSDEVREREITVEVYGDTKKIDCKSLQRQYS